MNNGEKNYCGQNLLILSLRKCPLLCMSLSGRARKATSELSAEELACEAGVDNIVKKLDRVFKQDENLRCFNNYLAFENYRRDKSENIDQYLSEFDRRHYKLRECGATLPDAVVACRLLKSCNLSDMHFQLALSTTPKMTFEDMRCTLKRLLSEGGSTLSSACGTSSTVNIKSENFPCETFYGERWNRNKRDSRR